MALIFLNQTKCSFCSEVIRTGNPYDGFPAFVYSNRDPLFRFNDAAYHVDCLEKSEFKQQLDERMALRESVLGVENRQCLVCEKSLINSEDVFFLGYIAFDKNDPLFLYNYTVSHISCLPNWTDLRKLEQLVSDMRVEDAYDLETRDSALRILRKALHTR